MNAPRAGSPAHWTGSRTVPRGSTCAGALDAHIHEATATMANDVFEVAKRKLTPSTVSGGCQEIVIVLPLSPQHR